MTDPRIIIAVLCGLVVGLFVMLLLFATSRFAWKSRAAAHSDNARAWMSKAGHERDAFIALTSAYNTLNDQLARAGNELAETRARLAPFIAKRERDPVTKRFLPAARSEAA